MKLPTLVEPQLPNNPNKDKVRFKIWSFEFTHYKKDSTNRKRDEKKAYSLIIGRCSPVVCDIIEAHRDWNEVNAKSDVISVLCLGGTRQISLEKFKTSPCPEIY